MNKAGISELKTIGISNFIPTDVLTFIADTYSVDGFYLQVNALKIFHVGFKIRYRIIADGLSDFYGN